MLYSTSTLLLGVLALSSSSIAAATYSPYNPTTMSSLPFTIMHRTSGRCFHPKGGSATPADNTQIVLYDGCAEPRLLFEYNSGTQTFKHVSSGKCLVPQNSNVQDNTALVLSSQCNSEDTKFTWGPSGIQHIKSGKCLHPHGGRANAGRDTGMVLHSGCGEERLAYDLVLPILRN
ncbi:hypothetical protein BKA69DRAFT_1099250 [Paraphysoderma sedebokerense]|nr:hypothetical protein BKA69DRAFT_1099250 [Paraphysoderma sedebokerense]